MPIWKPKPGEDIGQKEAIGRRLFEVPVLKGAVDQPRPADLLEVEHFLEHRGDHEVSVDRLGKSGLDGKVCKALAPLCHDAAAAMVKKSFQGWAFVAAQWIVPKDTIHVKLVPLPENGNDYHAQIEQPSHQGAYATALHLREIFQRRGDVHLQGKRPGRQRGTKQLVLDLFNRLRAFWSMK